MLILCLLEWLTRCYRPDGAVESRTGTILLSTTVVTNGQEAGTVVYESERSVPGIGDVFASQTRAEGDSGRASRCAARKRANAGFPVR